MTISQSLFDETLLENEEVFSLPPTEALQETIDQFCQQLGHSPHFFQKNDNEVLLQSIPADMAHLSLTHPDSDVGRTERRMRGEFRGVLDLLDGCVGEDGVVTTTTLPTDTDTTSNNCNDILDALTQLSTRLGYSVHEDALPYLIIFQQSSSIYTLMSFLTAVYSPSNSCGDSSSSSILQEEQCNLTIQQRVAQTLTVILTSSPKENVKCALLRGELRDLFVGGLFRLVPLLFQFATACGDDDNDNNDSITTSWNRNEQLQLVLIDLLKLSISAVRGCEGGKVAFVQSSLDEKDVASSSSSSSSAYCNTKRGGVQVIYTLLSNATTTNTTTSSSSEKTTTIIIETTCNLLATLCRYDDFRTPNNNNNTGTGVSTSSAHDHAMEFHRVGVERLLIKIADGVLTELELLNGNGNDERCNEEEGESSGSKKEMVGAAVLTALRVLAVNDEIIQTMVALGVLPIVTKALRLSVTTNDDATNDDNSKRNKSQSNNLLQKHRLAASSLGLLRNLCGNDEIKTNLCLGSTTNNNQQTSSISSTPSALPHLLHAMELYPTISPIQEHACGTLAAMALRRPANARAIITEGGPKWIVMAMRRHEENVSVQRQGALAVRNIVSRLMRDLENGGDGNNGVGVSVEDARSDIRELFGELGVEDVLRNIAGRHQGSVDEAYAALRDLGYSVALTKFSAEDLQEGNNSNNVVGRTMMFGEKHNSNFRPVYEQSAGLNNAVDAAVSNFCA